MLCHLIRRKWSFQLPNVWNIMYPNTVFQGKIHTEINLCVPTCIKCLQIISILFYHFVKSAALERSPRSPSHHCDGSPGGQKLLPQPAGETLQLNDDFGSNCYKCWRSHTICWQAARTWIASFFLCFLRFFWRCAPVGHGELWIMDWTWLNYRLAIGPFCLPKCSLYETVAVVLPSDLLWPRSAFEM